MTSQIVSAVPTTAVCPVRYVARQPILDARSRVVGYELLARACLDNLFQGESDSATREMLDTFLLLGVDALAKGSMAFVNCTREALVSQLVTLLTPQTTVLEVLETVQVDDDVINACREFKRLGYRIALDDFVPREDLRPLLPLADFIKVDFRASDASARREIHRFVRDSPAALVAEKIEDQQEFQTASEEGYRYFQGYYFCRPVIVPNRIIPANELNCIRLLAALSRDPMNLIEVEQVVMAETSLCYRLLRLVNSALFGFRREINSIHDALIMVGENEFRKLATVFIAAEFGRTRPHALVVLALQRARFCELLAPHLNLNPNEQYLLGMLSLIDAILRTPKPSVVNALPLRAQAKAALLGEICDCALPLTLIQKYERGDWHVCDDVVHSSPVSEETLTSLYLKSVRWAESSMLA